MRVSPFVVIIGSLSLALSSARADDSSSEDDEAAQAAAAHARLLELIRAGEQLSTASDTATATAAQAAPAASAAAPPYFAIDNADRAMQWEGGVGFDVGSFHTADVANLGTGFDVAAGVRFDRLAVLGEYRLLALGQFGASDPQNSEGDDASARTSTPMSGSSGGTPTGLVQRFGVMARYSVLETFSPCSDGSCGFRTDLWLEGGVGEQMIRWNAGGEANRPDLEFGLGASFGGRGPEHHAAYFLGVLATVAHTPASAVSNVATCAGPCDTPTPPLDLDRSILFTTGITFGG